MPNLPNVSEVAEYLPSTFFVRKKQKLRRLLSIGFCLRSTNVAKTLPNRWQLGREALCSLAPKLTATGVENCDLEQPFEHSAPLFQ